MNNNKVAVIIVNWNSGNYLRQCIKALSRQSRKPDKVIIVDNASSDNSLDNINTTTLNLNLIKRDKNFGFAASNNFAVSLCDDYKWLAFVNPDTEPTNDWLEKLLKAAAKQTQFSMFACKQLQMQNPDLLDGAGDCYHVSGLMWRRGYGKPTTAVPNIQCEVFSPCGGAALINRKHFLEAGGFDESFFCYAEDVDLGFRLRLMGHRCLYVPSAIIFHAGFGSTGKKSDFSLYHGHRNMVWVFFKNMPTKLFRFYFLEHLLINIITLLWFSFQGRTKVIFRAKVDALHGLPEVLKKRRGIQAGKKAETRELLNAMQRGWIRK